MFRAIHMNEVDFGGITMGPRGGKDNRANIDNADTP